MSRAKVNKRIHLKLSDRSKVETHSTRKKIILKALDIKVTCEVTYQNRKSLTVHFYMHFRMCEKPISSQHFSFGLLFPLAFAVNPFYIQLLNFPLVRDKVK